VPNPAFIVEGQMEQRIIARACPGTPVRRIGCNGDDVSIDRICDFIETQIRALGNRNYPIFVLFDREKREQSSDDIKSSVINILNSRGLADQDIRVFVANRKTEDWYLHDIKGICDYYSIAEPQQKVNGKKGLEILLSSIGGYHETTIGVELFFVVSKKKIGEACPIFLALTEAAVEIGCPHFLEQGLL